MLIDRNEGKNQSWAILWYASAFIKNKFCLYPPVSLVNNIGNDGSGTHTFIPTDKFGNVESANFHFRLPDEIKESSQGRKNFELFFRSLRQNNILSKIKSVVPDKIKQSLKNVVGKKGRIPWSGNYDSWEEAKERSTGYNASLILEKVKDSIIKVKNGMAVYERDSVLFQELHFSENILKTFLASADMNRNRLHVTDFGGSLGSTYYQYKNVIDRNISIRWNVIEQPHFVECGLQYFQDGELKFYLNVEEALRESERDVLMLASVLPYVESPYLLIKSLVEYKFQYIIVDRTAFISGHKDRLTVQTVPENIYSASYPAWFFNEKKFIDAFTGKYSLLEQFLSDVSLPAKLGNEQVWWKGFIFKLNNA